MPPFRRRRPLLRAAAVGGGAYMLGKRHADSQADEQAEAQQAAPAQQAPPAQQAAPAPAAAPPARGMSPEAMDQLKQLADLHSQGILTDEEFADQKAKLLAS